MNATARKLIVVLGMHRSGTSAMTRGLGAIGVDLGEDFLPTMHDVNARGFWEDKELHQINLEVLRLLGVDWLTNRPLMADEFAAPAVAALRAPAADLIRRKTADSPVFAFKDPRTTILLPFWKPVFAAAGVAAEYLLAIRNPRNVAESIARRDGFARAKTYGLWLRYSTAMLLDTTGLPRVVVDFDLLMDDPLRQLDRLADALGLRHRPAGGEAEFASRFLAAELRHNRHPLAELRDDPELPAVVADLYLALHEVAADRQAIDSPAARAAVDAAERTLRGLTPFLAYMDALEFAVARAGNPPGGSSLWVDSLRCSFGIATPSDDPAPTAVATPTPPGGGTVGLLRRLFGKSRAR